MKTKILIILIVALTMVHIVLLIPAVMHPERFQTRDSLDYLDLARTFLSTGKYAGTVYPGVDLMRPPVYPIFIMFSLLIGQGQDGAIVVFQGLIYFATAWLVYGISARMGYKLAGMTAAVLFLLNPNATFWSAVQMTELLAGFFVALSLWCCVNYLQSNKRTWILPAGLALSAGALTRPILFPMSILLGVVFCLVEWRRTHRLTQALSVSALLILAILALVLPWQVRNLVIHGRFTLSEVGESTFQNWYVAQTLASAEGISRDEASARIAMADSPMRYSLEVIRTYPWTFIKEQARGILRTALGAEYGTWAQAYTGHDTGTTGVLSAFLDQGSLPRMLASLRTQAENPWFWAGMYALGYDIVLASAILLGLWKVFGAYRHERFVTLAILVMVALAYLIIIPGVAGESRFRAPADPLLALAGGWAVLPRRR
jgi:4-amino-4-deoxy-L-arabinose transferase-like glycosyltransferase